MTGTSNLICTKSIAHGTFTSALAVPPNTLGKFSDLSGCLHEEFVLVLVPVDVDFAHGS